MPARRKLCALAIATTILFFLFPTQRMATTNDSKWHNLQPLAEHNLMQIHYPVTSFTRLSSSRPVKIPAIQHAFKKQLALIKWKNQLRLAAVKGNFTHAWYGYKQHGWSKDKHSQLSGGFKDPRGVWAATLVDTLDSLWIMDLRSEFDEAISYLTSINFTTHSLDSIELVESTTRRLGALLSAYDISNRKYPVILQKAIELGDILYLAFDPSDHMPTQRQDSQSAPHDMRHIAYSHVSIAEIGCLTLEFTRLSQVSKDPKYYDAIQRGMERLYRLKQKTKLPGTLSKSVDVRDLVSNAHGTFTIAGMADSTFECLAKQNLLLDGVDQQYAELYQRSMLLIKEHVLYRPMIKQNRQVLLAGKPIVDERTHGIATEPQAQHLACFAGGVVGLASRVFGVPQDLVVARQLMEGCLWAYENMPLGIMPEFLHTVPCTTGDNSCVWDEAKWYAGVAAAHNAELSSAQELIQTHRLPAGVTKIDDRQYLLRPEAIESIFILYRLTGDQTLRGRAWTIFEKIAASTITDVAHAALADCTVPELPKSDKIVSSWLAETLKYFYLIFADENLINLDDWVFSRDAHPLRRNRVSGTKSMLLPPVRRPPRRQS